jgi:hypothetical protein
MKKMAALLMLFLFAAPAIATDVTITAVAGPGPNNVTVGFTTANLTEPVRMICLDVIVDDPDVVIADINCVNDEYGIYPGSISIDASGNVTDWGSCAGSGIDSNLVSTEQGSLYVGANTPAQSGDLFIITLGGCTCSDTGEFTVTVRENVVRGGIVLEDPNEYPIVVLPSPAVVSYMSLCAGCGPYCNCLGDISGPMGVPDGVVSTSDMGAILGLLGAAGPPYSVPLPDSSWECMDISGPTGVPDGLISTADMVALLAYLGAIGMPYVGPCMPSP